MMDFIMIPVVVGIITMGICRSFELFVRRKERMAIIEKMGEKFDASMIVGKFELPINAIGSTSFSTLKWACLLLGVGLGFLVGFLITYNTLGIDIPNDGWGYDRIAGIIYGANVLLFGGLGLLIAFLVEMRYSKKSEK